MTLEPAVKRCSECGQTKSLTEFHRNSRTSGGHVSRCKPCATARVLASQAKRRAEMGEAAWLEHQRTIQNRSRAARGYTRERVWSRAQWNAMSALVAAHRKEYDALLQRALYEAEAAS